MDSFVKDVFRVGISNFLMIFLGLGTSIITARYLGPEGNGIISGLLVYPSLFMTIGSLGIRQSVTYFLGKKIYNEDEIKTAITQIWFLSTLFSVLICFFLIRYFNQTGNNLFLVTLAVLPIPFSLFNTYNSGVFLGKNEIGKFNKINWIPSLIVFIGTAGFVVAFQFEVAGALIALIGGPLFMASILLFKNKFIKAFSLQFNWKIIKSMLSLGIIYAVSLLVINLNYKIDIILLDKFSSSFEMGIYSKGSGITQYLWQIPMLLSTIVFARSAVSKNDRKFSYKVTQLLRVSMVAIGIASLLFFLFSEVIIVGMYGEDFRGSIQVLKFLLPGVLILTIFKVMNMDLAGKGKPWVSMKAMIPALVINIVLNIVFIPKFGANGAALASTISYSLAGSLFLLFYSKTTKISIKEIITYKKLDFAFLKNLLFNFK